MRRKAYLANQESFGKGEGAIIWLYTPNPLYRLQELPISFNESLGGVSDPPVCRGCGQPLCLAVQQGLCADPACNQA